MMTTDDMILYDQLVDMGIATADEINLVFDVADKSWQDVLHGVLYSRTGYRSIEQMLECE